MRVALVLDPAVLPLFTMVGPRSIRGGSSLAPRAGLVGVRGMTQRKTGNTETRSVVPGEMRLIMAVNYQREGGY